MRVLKYIEIEVPNDDENERCILCKKLTDIKKDCDIDFREHYVYGVGQLCAKCYKELYIKNKKSNLGV